MFVSISVFFLYKTAMLDVTMPSAELFCVSSLNIYYKNEYVI